MAMKKKSWMMKRKDGSMSKRGMWDNIRSKAKENKRTWTRAKKPTTAMLKQGKKIRSKKK